MGVHVLSLCQIVFTLSCFRVHMVVNFEFPKKIIALVSCNHNPNHIPNAKLRHSTLRLDNLGRAFTHLFHVDRGPLLRCSAKLTVEAKSCAWMLAKTTNARPYSDTTWKFAHYLRTLQESGAPHRLAPPMIGTVPNWLHAIHMAQAHQKYNALPKQLNKSG